MTLTLIILTLLFAIAGISKAVSDKVTTHFDRSIFSNYDSFLWNPEMSWRNKWKNGNRKEGESFFLSSTLLVWATDAWHLFNTFRALAYFIAIAICLQFEVSTFYAVIIALSGWTVRTVVFHLFYTYFFEKDFYKFN